MTNEQAIARVAAKIPSIRRNKDGSLNGNAVSNYIDSLKNTFKANGMDHNDACRAAYRAMDELRKGA